jgi:hypothetical protein
MTTLCILSIAFAFLAGVGDDDFVQMIFVSLCWMCFVVLVALGIMSAV